MELGMGVIGWTPDTFWRATPIELRSALRGWQRSQGVNPDDGKQVGHGMSEREVTELQEFMDTMPDQFVAGEEDNASGI